MSKNPKRQELPPGLWVVGTPIGNLADVTDRARQALTEADLILCEDTRQGLKLLRALEIHLTHPRLERFDQHAPPQAIRRWMTEIEAGKNIAVISDAGTPGISDPGVELVREAHERGIRVTPVPGASALTTFLSAAGLSTDVLTFRGFFPRKKKDREEEVLQLGSGVVVWYESPKRVESALEFLLDHFKDQPAVAAKELTKIHERFFVGSLEQITQSIKIELQSEGARGEWVISILCNKSLSKGEKLPWEMTLSCLIDCGIGVAEATRKIGQKFGVSRNQVYPVALQFHREKSTSIP